MQATSFSDCFHLFRIQNCNNCWFAHLLPHGHSPWLHEREGLSLGEPRQDTYKQPLWITNGSLDKLLQVCCQGHLELFPCLIHIYIYIYLLDLTPILMNISLIGFGLTVLLYNCLTWSIMFHDAWNCMNFPLNWQMYPSEPHHCVWLGCALHSYRSFYP